MTQLPLDQLRQDNNVFVLNGTSTTQTFYQCQTTRIVTTSTVSAQPVIVYTGGSTQVYNQNSTNPYVSHFCTSTSTTYNSTSSITTIYSPNLSYANPKIKVDRRKEKKKIHYARKALWKSIRFYESLFGLNDIKLFLNGQSFEIEGRRFNYRISKGFHGLLEHTANPNSLSIPYRLEVFSKSGVYLFRGCTIFRNTPLVDQITALILHIQNGKEDHIIKNMNLLMVDKALYNDVDSMSYISELKGPDYIRRREISYG